MKKRLNFSETIVVGSMLFGLFFGAGNLIFPAIMGQLAGSNVWPAAIGFLTTGVGIPLFGVAAIGMSKSDGLFDMATRFLGKGYGLFFTCVLYLTIGPFFAIPRCASTSFSVGIAPMVDQATEKWLIWVFALVFFAVVLFFSLRPGKILTWVGKILTPLFLISLGILIITALISPMGDFSAVTPQKDYASNAFFKGFIEGYNTMDALAGLAFGIVVIDSIRRLGVTEPTHIASNTVRSGIFGCVIMAVIYIMLALVGAESGTVSADGGEALHYIAAHYFKNAGGIILAVIVTLACLKTAVGLITSCGEMFCQMFPKGPSYKAWAIGFCVVSFLISTVGLNAIIAWSLPVLMFLYPLAITLIILVLFGKLYENDRAVYISVTAFTLIPAIIDLVASLPYGLPKLPILSTIVKLGGFLPLSQVGLSWICPALLGLTVGVIIHIFKKAETKAE